MDDLKLTADELQLLHNYRALNDTDKATIRDITQLYAKREGEARAARKHIHRRSTNEHKGVISSHEESTVVPCL